MRFLLVVPALLAAASPAPAHAQVEAVTLGIHTNCPYGLTG